MHRLAAPVLPCLLAACTGASPHSDDTGVHPLADCSSLTPSLHRVALSELSLDLACQGTSAAGAPTVLMLHGFPEFWRGWAAVMPLLADEHRVVAPDQRGYDTSDKPVDVEDYGLDHLVTDVVDLVALLDGPVVLVGHDWGGAVAWAVAARHPDLVDRLVILNAPHLDVFSELLQTDEDQAEAFSYVDFFVQPGSEDVLVANDFAVLSTMFEGVLTEDELAAYKTAWGQERAIEGGLNWYRANFEDGLPVATDPLVVDVPTLVLWGMDDTALLSSNLDGLPEYVSDLEIQEVPGATHWIAHEEPQLVADAIAAFME